MIRYAKNVENPATFVEGFWPEFLGRGRFMKYSMFVDKCPQYIPPLYFLELVKSTYPILASY